MGKRYRNMVFNAFPRFVETAVTSLGHMGKYDVYLLARRCRTNLRGENLGRQLQHLAGDEDLLRIRKRGFKVLRILS